MREKNDLIEYRGTKENVSTKESNHIKENNRINENRIVKENNRKKENWRIKENRSIKADGIAHGNESLDSCRGNNWTHIRGIAESGLRYSHCMHGKKFYELNLLVSRTSANFDRIPLTICEDLVDAAGDYAGRVVEAVGEFRSYHKEEGRRRRLILTVFVRHLQVAADDMRMPEGVLAPANSIYLDGFLCKHPVYRMTPFGREITELFVAVNRARGKADYVPCICWGRSARCVGMLQVGSHVQLWGRIQSRCYRKHLSENHTEQCTVYEVSVSGFDIVSY